MPGKWDDVLKLLIAVNPQHFVDWLVEGATFEGERSTELKNRTIQADILYNVSFKKQEMVLHIEFQRRKDRQMVCWVCLGFVLTTYTSGLPVLSIVIYVKKGGKIIEPPFTLALPDGEIVHQFNFRNIKLWEISVETLKGLDLVGLLPLLPLTKDGARREIVEEMKNRIVATGQYELLQYGFFTAADVLRSDDDREWLRRSFAMYKDLLEDNWLIKELMQEGLEKGLEKGMQEGLEKGLQEGLEKGLQEGLEKGRREGEILALRQLLQAIVQERFPQILELTRQQANISEDPETLRSLAVKMSVVKTAEEAEQRLLAIASNKTI